MPFFKKILNTFLFFPSRKIKVIGATGTKGKSTTLEFLSKILEKGSFKIALFHQLKSRLALRKNQIFIK